MQDFVVVLELCSISLPYHPPLSVFKAYLGGFWYQNKNTFSNMNIFSSMMSVEDMVTRTAGGPGCDSPGDYFR